MVCTVKFSAYARSATKKNACMEHDTKFHQVKKTVLITNQMHTTKPKLTKQLQKNNLSVFVVDARVSKTTFNIHTHDLQLLEEEGTNRNRHKQIKVVQMKM
ncbi:hypothetical protein ABZP36_022656 [Zizania latifolia]